MGKILFISSFNTGHGHKSITEALREQIKMLDPDTLIEEVDGFMLGGSFSASMSRMYDRIVLRAPLFWKIYYELGNIFPGVANFYTAKSIKKALLQLIENSRPDLIVSVHPCYVSSVESIIEEKHLNIPVVSLVADLDNVSRLWVDRRSLFTVCPTENAKCSVMKFGVPEDRIKVFGFPARDRFNHFEPDHCVSYYKQITSKDRLNFLIMNGSQGKQQVIEIAKQLLDHFDCNVTILAGNNKDLKATVEKSLESYGSRAAVLGFINNVEKYMQESDILLLRASPNVLTEAVNLCKPFIVTGALTGQEERNPVFVQENHLGVVCSNIRKLPETVNQLLTDEGRKIDSIVEHQYEFRKTDASKRIAEFLLSILQEST
jgi:processive 1,2-diacylglycerol beta-glucosyltransferase